MPWNVLTRNGKAISAGFADMKHMVQDGDVIVEYPDVIQSVIGDIENNRVKPKTIEERLAVLEAKVDELVAKGVL